MRINNKKYVRQASIITGIVLGVLLVVGCAKDAKNNKNKPDTEQTTMSTSTVESVDYEIGKINEVGEGKNEFSIKIINQKDVITVFNIKTDKEILGDALCELGLISGKEGPYGMFVEEVCGEKHVYEETGSYWSLYVNNIPATTGADTTKIDKDKEYKFVVEED